VGAAGKLTSIEVLISNGAAMRKRNLLIAALSATVVACSAAAVIMWEPTLASVPAPPVSSSDSQTRIYGARVVALGDCFVCHTTKGGKPFAGGLPLETPFGTIYSTNITPDAATGIGSWSLEAFTRAMRRGIARDGHQLYPAFPYLHFTRMSDGDIAAAYAYLMSLDPVEAKAPDNDLIFPLNFRPLVAFWNVLFLKPGEQKPEPSASAEWNRGRMLVDGPGHCAACHSPLNLIGGEKSGKAFGGGLVDGWEAPALDALGSAVVPWTKAQLVTYLRTGRASEHGAAAGPMLPVTQELAAVPVSDVEAIATYILSIQKPGTVAAMQPVSNVGRPPEGDSVRRGEALFNAACAACHGNGAPMQAIGGRPGLTSSTAVNARSPRNVIQMMMNGVPWQGAGSIHFMPLFSESLRDDQLADLAGYLRAAYSREPAWTEVAKMVSEIRMENNSR